LKIAQNVSEGEEIVKKIVEPVEQEKPKKAREIREKKRTIQLF